MKALSVQQLWAWLIVNALKDVENRGWGTLYRGRIYIHAGLREDRGSFGAGYDFSAWIWERLPKGAGSVAKALWFSEVNKAIPFPSGLVGEVDLVGCIPPWRECASPWAEEEAWHWVLANPVAYPEPIPYKGRLGLFEVTLA